MRLIKVSQRDMRILRDTLTSHTEGYDYTDLLRIDFLASKMTDAMGDLATRLAELSRNEKQARRRHRKGEITDLELNKTLNIIRIDVDELNEIAEETMIQLRVEDGDHTLIAQTLESVQRWTSTDDVRKHIIRMRHAVATAETLDDTPAKQPAEPDEIEPKVSRMKRPG